MKSYPVAGIATPSSATFSDFVKDDADDPHPLWAHGQYGPQLDGILAQLGQIAIVPTAWYLAAAGPTITGLLSLVQRRSGKRSQRPPLATLQGEARHENAGKHPLLATEITSPVERQRRVHGGRPNATLLLSRGAARGFHHTWRRFR